MLVRKARTLPLQPGILSEVQWHICDDFFKSSGDHRHWQLGQSADVAVVLRVATPGVTVSVSDATATLVFEGDNKFKSLSCESNSNLTLEGIGEGHLTAEGGIDPGIDIAGSMEISHKSYSTKLLPLMKCREAGRKSDFRFSQAELSIVHRRAQLQI
jgi:hypothetical protein